MVGGMQKFIEDKDSCSCNNVNNHINIANNTQDLISSASTPPSIALMDSGSTGTLLHPASLDLPCVQRANHHDPLTVRFAGGDTVCHSIDSAILTTNNTSTNAWIMPNDCLHHQLIGGSPFTEQGATIVYNNDNGTIYDRNNNVLMTGTNEGSLWRTNLANLRPNGPPVGYNGHISVSSEHDVQGEVNYVSGRTRNIQERVKFFQILMGNPTTWSVNRALIVPYVSGAQGWPVPTAHEYSTHAIETEAVHQGHMRELRGNIRSTKPVKDGGHARGSAPLPVVPLDSPSSHPLLSHSLPSNSSPTTELDDDIPIEDRDLEPNKAYVFVRESTIFSHRQ